MKSKARTIHPQFFANRPLFVAECETGLPLRLVLASLWTAADREGRFSWDVVELKAACLPLDSIDYGKALDALACPRLPGEIHRGRPGLRTGRRLAQGSAHQRQGGQVCPSTPTGRDAREPLVSFDDARRRHRDPSQTTGATPVSWEELPNAIIQALRMAQLPIPPDMNEIDLWQIRGFLPALCLGVVQKEIETTGRLNSLEGLSLAICRVHREKGITFIGRSVALLAHASVRNTS